MLIVDFPIFLHKVATRLASGPEASNHLVALYFILHRKLSTAMPRYEEIPSPPRGRRWSNMFHALCVYHRHERRPVESSSIGTQIESRTYIAFALLLAPVYYSVA
ncbi:hypothetical protein IG631_20931 [Alternaria alternata]|nr:hypothetical protein IG631_20931 [Alternaria alternata]